MQQSGGLSNSLSLLRRSVLSFNQSFVLFEAMRPLFVVYTVIHLGEVSLVFSPNYL